MLISIGCFTQKKEWSVFDLSIKKAWSVDELIKLADSKYVNALLEIVNPLQIMCVDTTQAKKLIELEKKTNSNLKKSYD